LAYLPGEILFHYAQELRDKSCIATKTWRPSLDDYDHMSPRLDYDHFRDILWRWDEEEWLELDW
jgi:hypothetical protein